MTRPGPSARVIVVGSLNHDVVLAVEALPAPGETVLARSRTTGPGGKGANQAIAAALAGAPTAMIGAVGDDAAGEVLLDALRRAGVDTGAVAVVRGPTGEATVIVDEAGDNAIVVVTGANASLPDAIDAVRGALRPRRGDVVVAQLEAAPDAVAGVLAASRAAGATTVLNVAPAVGGGRAAAAHADHVVVNEVELAAPLWRHGPRHDESPAVGRAALAGALHRQLGAVVVATAGEQPTLVFADGRLTEVPSPPVAVVDSTGAGDAFVGTYAAALAAGRPPAEAAHRAAAVAADTVTRAGASASYRPNAAAVVEVAEDDRSRDRDA